MAKVRKKRKKKRVVYRHETMPEVQTKIERVLKDAKIAYAVKSMKAYWIKSDGSLTSKYRGDGTPHIWLVGVFVGAATVEDRSGR